MEQFKPIGLFDSGIGGTSIWREIRTLLPQENTIYLSDSKNSPYGKKTQQEILDLSVKNTELLLNKDCKAIVVACNTATTNTIDFLRKNYPRTPFIGIEPAIKPASLKTKTKHIGILATQGTLSSSLFYKTSGNISNKIIIHEQNGEGLVNLIEKGKIDSDETLQLLLKYVNPMLAKDIDCLVLGCTHYPYLIPQIKKIVGSKVTLIDSGFAVAKQLKNILKSNNLLQEQKTISNHQFYCNKNTDVLKSLLKKEFNIKIGYLDF